VINETPSLSCIENLNYISLVTLLCGIFNTIMVNVKKRMPLGKSRGEISEIRKSYIFDYVLFPHGVD
jgi:hypothetical protein